MATHQTPPNEEENPQEQAPTYEDKLAEKLSGEGFAREQQVSLQVALALMFGGATYYKEVKNSYAFLAKEIDPEKLIKDPVYKRQVERALQLVKRHEGKKIADGRSRFSQIAPKVERAIERTNACHSKLQATKSALLLNDEIYLNHLKETYGLDDKQLKAIKDGAWARARENPSLSMKDALRIEAEGFFVKQATTEVEKENKGKKLSQREKETLVKQKLADKQSQYESAVKTRLGQAKSEEEKIREIIASHIEENKQILAAASPATTTPQPAPVTPPTPVIPPPPSTMPLSASPAPKFSFPSFSLPAGLTQRLGNAFGGVGKVFGGLGKGLGSIFGRSGLFSKAFDLVSRVGKQLINRGLDAIVPGLGMVAGKINEVIRSILGIDVEDLILKGAVVVVGIVAAVVVILPIIIGVGVFSHITGANPIQVSLTNDRTIGWNEFNKQYLTLEKDVFINKKISWQQFEKESLTPQKPYLSLEKFSQ